MYRRRWREQECVDQVINGRDSLFDLTPASDAPALATRAAWAPLLPGQAVPLPWERAAPDPYDDCCR